MRTRARAALAGEAAEPAPMRTRAGATVAGEAAEPTLMRPRTRAAVAAAAAADLGNPAAAEAAYLVHPAASSTLPLLPRATAPSSAPIKADDAGRSDAEADLASASVAADLSADVSRSNLKGEGKDVVVNTALDGVTTSNTKDCIKTGKEPQDWIKNGKEFAIGFYHKLGNAPKDLHMLYHHHCDVSWNIFEKSYTMKSPKNVLATQTIQQGNFYIHNHVIQENNHSLQVVVYGAFILENISSSFFEAFVLCRHKLIILNDALVIGLHVPQQLNVKRDSRLAAETSTKVPRRPKFKIKTDVNRAAEIAAKEAQIAALGSSEKPEVLVIYNKECLEHIPSYYHEENPHRITNIIAALKRDGVYERVQFLESVLASRKQVLAVHTENLLKEVIDKLPLSDEQTQTCPYISSQEGDMYSSSGTPRAVLLAAGAVIKACHSVAKRDFKKAFALVRPPGHHASAELSEGFCYINNTAIGVKYLQEQLGIKKIMVVDIDVHHGNGTQDIFYEDDTVLVFSIHSKSVYPLNHGKAHTFIGKAKGRGYNVNVPLDAGYGNSDVLYALDHLLAPLVSMFQPEMIVVSAGYDAAKLDPLGNCQLDNKCYGTIAKKLVQLGNGSLVMVLEGGYGPNLGDCVSNTLRGLMGDKDAGLSEKELMSRPSKDTVDVVRDVKAHLNLQGVYEI